MALWQTFLRWRHSKGFGVHSPYAYRFVTDVVRPGPYQYYSYWEIETLLKGKDRHDYKLQRMVKFIIRLGVFLKVKRIVNYGKSRFAEPAAKALKLQYCDYNRDKNLRLTDKDLFICDGSLTDADLLKKAISMGISICAFKPRAEIRSFLETPIERGVIFIDKEMLILIPRKEMAYVSYPMLLHP